MRAGAVIVCGDGDLLVSTFDSLISSSLLKGATIYAWDSVTCEALMHDKPVVQVVPLNLSEEVEIWAYVCLESGADRARAYHEIVSRFPKANFPSFVHERALISSTSSLARGVIVGQFASIGPECVLEQFCVVRSGAAIASKCVVKSCCTIGPQAVVCSSSILGHTVHVGANATIRDKVEVSDGTVVGIGAVVTQTIPLTSGRIEFWGGVPAKSEVKESFPSGAKGVIRWCFKKPFNSIRFMHYAQPSIALGHITNDGPLQQILQAKVKALVRSQLEILLASNGTAALHALVAGLAMFKGKASLTWATQAFTFPSSIQGPLFNSVVIDNDNVALGPSLSELDRIKDTIDGVIVTNVFGFQSDIVSYELWCQKNGKLLVFDNAATPIGFLPDGRSIHDIGDGSIISLHETKPLGRGEGGVIVMRRELVKHVHKAMNFGFDTTVIDRIPNRQSSNWRMSDLAAAAICDHIDYIIAEEWLVKYQDMISKARDRLLEIGHDFAWPVPSYTVLSCLFVRLPEKMDANHAMAKMQAWGIEAKHYYRPLEKDRIECPNSWKLYDSTICLPFHMGMSEIDIKFVTDCLVKLAI